MVEGHYLHPKHEAPAGGEAGECKTDVLPDDHERQSESRKEAGCLPEALQLAWCRGGLAFRCGNWCDLVVGLLGDHHAQV